MASITRYDGATGVSFQVRYRVNGKQRTKTFRAIKNTKTEINKAERIAKQFANDIEAEKTLGIAILESNLTFEEYAERFFLVHGLNKKESTKNNYNIYSKKINKVFGNKRLSDITPSQLDDYFMSLKNSGFKTSTIKKYRDILSLVLKSAYKKDLIKSNPLDKIDFSFSDEFNSYAPKKDKIISLKEFAVIFNSFHVKYYKSLLLLGLLTGMRTGEMLALTWNDIDFDKKEINVNKTIDHKLNVTPPKSKSSIRTIIMFDWLYELMNTIKNNISENKKIFGKSYQDNNLVICKENGEYIKPRQVAKTMYEKSKTYNVNFKMHSLRHTFASLLSDANIKDVQAILGHAKADITANTYQHQMGIKDDTIIKLNTVFQDYIKSVL